VGCDWCDTRYSWDGEAGREADSGALWSELSALGSAPLLVITGGEPGELPQLGELLDDALARWSRVEVETSGVAPPARSHPRLFYNVSPKLPSATPRWERTWAHAQAWLAEPRATFKIVVGDDPDLADALRLIAAHALPAARIMLMPEGLTDEVVRSRATRLAEACTRHGFRLSPRLHVWMWGAKRGR
jgi:7-carboxy-7-deazaguanine synthase